MKLELILLENFVVKKKFYTRGLPFAKKMWRDGYNKALDDFLTFIKMQSQNESDKNL